MSTFTYILTMLSFVVLLLYSLKPKLSNYSPISSDRVQSNSVISRFAYDNTFTEQPISYSSGPSKTSSYYWSERFIRNFLNSALVSGRRRSGRRAAENNNQISSFKTWPYEFVFPCVFLSWGSYRYQLCTQYSRHHWQLGRWLSLTFSHSMFVWPYRN